MLTKFASRLGRFAVQPLRKHCRVVRVACLGVFSWVTVIAAAPPPSSDSIVVTATNGGGLTFTISSALYSFGTVSAAGGPNIGGTQALVGSVTASGATYTATSATTWRAATSPPATIFIYNSSATSVLQWGVPGRLELQIPTTNLSAGSVSCGFRAFDQSGSGGAAGCGSGNLVRNVVVKNGANATVGNLDLRLSVNNTDGLGANTWVVIITEVGF